MHAALEEAKAAAARDEVPIGAVLVERATGQIVSRHSNRTRELHDPSAHAEMLCIREICSTLGSQRAVHNDGYDLFVTLEPCAMCAAVISFARIKRVIFGAPDPKGGGVLHGGKFYEQSTCHHRPEITHDILSNECAEILKTFFKQKRKNSKT